jgi:protein-L-isoaspartate(D-aspartate) O-methyltransferase
VTRRHGIACWPVALALAGCMARSGEPPSDAALAAARSLMVERDLRGRGIGDERVLGAMGRVPRHRFVPPELQGSAYADQALPIGHEQTISQPYIVALMTELLDLPATARVLEVGTGSGYQAAVLAEMGAEVYSIEIVAPLAESARQLLAALGYKRVQVRAGDGYFGWPDAAPFDAVIVTAAAPTVPPALVAQLKEGGVMVLPAGSGERQYLMRGRKVGGAVDFERVEAVRFVPMTGEVER